MKLCIAAVKNPLFVVSMSDEPLSWESLKVASASNGRASAKAAWHRLTVSPSFYPFGGSFGV